jgi:hypothetical protein
VNSYQLPPSCNSFHNTPTNSISPLQGKIFQALLIDGVNFVSRKDAKTQRINAKNCCLTTSKDLNSPIQQRHISLP